jgi:hypothetical protein
MLQDIAWRNPLPRSNPKSFSNPTYPTNPTNSPHQGATTTYSLRALPLLGYVRFLNAAQLRAAAADGAHGAHSMYGARPERLLETLPPGRRAVVLVAGVVANMVLAAALVAYQVRPPSRAVQHGTRRPETGMAVVGRRAPRGQLLRRLNTCAHFNSTERLCQKGQCLAHKFCSPGDRVGTYE